MVCLVVDMVDYWDAQFQDRRSGDIVWIAWQNAKERNIKCNPNFVSMKSYGQTMAVTVILIATVITLICILLPSFQAHALGQKFFATLRGEEEIPPNNSSERGWVWMENLGDSIEYTINVTGLDKVMAAHLHTGEAGRNGDPIVTLFHAGPSGLINGTLTRGNITSSEFQGPMSGKSIEDLLNKMTQGKTYINIHTGSFPDGELRGQISTKNATAMTNNMGNQSSWRK